MSKNKVRKSISLNKTNPDDFKIINKIDQEDFNFNGWVRAAMIEKIRREENAITTKNGGIKIIVG